MEGNNLIKKGLVVAVILLFLSVSVIPSTGTTDVKQITVPTAKGDTLYVGGSGPNNYTRIQDAIDNASDGDTVFVYDDSSPYYENLIVDKSINLIGEDRDATIIDGGRIGDVIYVSKDNVKISNFNIQHSSEDRSKASIHLRSNNSIIEENIIQKNRVGIYLCHGNNNLITNNDILNDRIGIYFHWHSHYNTISDNLIFSNGYYGISMVQSNNNDILHNKIISNRYIGMVISLSDYNNIIGNYISDSRDEGIWLINNNNYNNIIRNHISQNSFGIRFSQYDGTTNNIYHNNFFDNTQNAYDDIGNTWDNSYPSGGNYWDDYTGNDSDGDGIGDTPYPIPVCDNEDRYPLMEPYGQTELEIGFISGGLFRINAEIKNIGRYNATEVKWTIKVLGRLPPIINKWSGEIDNIKSNKSETITTGFIIGFGKYNITVTAEASNAPTVTKSINGYIILFLILIKQ